MFLLGAVDLNAVAAIASATTAVLALLVAVLTAYYQRRALDTAWQSNSANMITSFSTVYDSDEMRRHRKQFAQALVDNKDEKLDLAGSVPVLEFFEDLGYLTRRMVIDRGMVWNHFFWSIEHYYCALTRGKNRLDEVRKQYETPTIYREFEWVYTNLSAIDQSESKASKYVAPTDEEVNRFLKNESQLPLGGS